MRLGKKIKALRGFMPRSELAKRVGVTSQAIYNWEEEKGSPSGEHISKLADALETTADYLLGRTKEGKK